MFVKRKATLHCQCCHIWTPGTKPSLTIYTSIFMLYKYSQTHSSCEVICYVFQAKYLMQFVTMTFELFYFFCQFQGVCGGYYIINASYVFSVNLKGKILAYFSFADKNAYN